MLRAALFVLLSVVAAPAHAQLADWIDARPGAKGLSLAGATVVTADGDHAVVGIAAEDLRSDLQTVTGQPEGGGAQIWAGTIGRNPAIDRLIASGKLDASKLKGAWESFIIATVERPAPGIPRALVIVGSDRRGAAYGIYELSRAIGVSPWHWWADVPAAQHASLVVKSGTHRFGPPSVKYRGIFINDEDWGLVPWAAGTNEPVSKGGTGNVGPKTYGRMFELLLRLKANTLWPGMHPGTTPFNANPDNAKFADRYGIVMGSSHAEPMLRNNVGEWHAPAADFDFVHNRDGVLAYWEDRVRANGMFESMYTLGMRGIHDSGMVGPTSLEERKATLERIFADQRAMIAKHAGGSAERVTQAFTPYKEVLDVYQNGLKVPEDVTIVWPDDNFGYIRHFPSEAEAARPGGSGVYYHLSYLGAPLSYLWLYTTPPALVWQEMTKAYALGARNIWIANVGDLKPAEIGIDLFLDIAWDVSRWQGEDVQRRYLRDWASRTFGADGADEIARILDRHFRLNFERRPEHLQWALPGEKYRQSPLTIREAQARMAEMDSIAEAAEALNVPLEGRDALFELVQYPVRAAALANARFFHTEAYDRLRESDAMAAREHGLKARAADAALAALTERYNRDTAGGKWRGILSVEPADGLWKSYRLTPPVLPSEAMLDALAGFANDGNGHPANGSADQPVEIDAVAFVARTDHQGLGWRRILGLGRGEGAITVEPYSRTAFALADASKAPRADYRIALEPGEWKLRVEMLPTLPIREGKGLRAGIAIDDGPIREVAIEPVVGSPAWAQGVLSNRLTADLPINVSGAGEHWISLFMLEPGVVIDGLNLSR